MPLANDIIQVAHLVLTCNKLCYNVRVTSLKGHIVECLNLKETQYDLSEYFTHSFGCCI